MAEKPAKKRYSKPSPSRGGSRQNTGGARPGSGPKPLEIRAIIAQIAAYEVNGRHASIIAFEKLVEMVGATEVDGERVKLCRAIIDRQLGKPRESLEVKMDRSTSAMEALDAASITLAAELTSRSATTTRS